MKSISRANPLRARRTYAFADTMFRLVCTCGCQHAPALANQPAPVSGTCITAAFKRQPAPEPALTEAKGRQRRIGPVAVRMCLPTGRWPDGPPGSMIANPHPVENYAPCDRWMRLPSTTATISNCPPSAAT